MRPFLENISSPNLNFNKISNVIVNTLIGGRYDFVSLVKYVQQILFKRMFKQKKVMQKKLMRIDELKRIAEI